MAGDEPPRIPEILDIRHAPSRIRRQYYLAERRNGRIAVAILFFGLGTLGWGLFQLVRWLLGP